MTQPITIPGGRNKGTPITEADDKDIAYWVTTKSAALGDGSSKYPDHDRKWLEAATAEQERRKKGGKPAAPTPRADPNPAPRAAAGAPSSALATRTPDKLVGGFHNAIEVTAALEEAAKLYHLVSPATVCGALPEGCGVAISLVKVDPTLDSENVKGPGEVYPAGGGKVGLSATPLKKIGAAAGVDWDMRQSGRLDDGHDPHYCHYAAVGTVKNFDGSRRTISGEVEIDARDGSPLIDEIKTKAERRRKEHPDWNNDGGASQILELRKFLLRHAETKAKLRAIADMGVKRSYWPKELEKPFAVARLMWTGQTKDPELKRFFAEKQFDAMVGSASAMYANAAPPALPAPRGHAPPPVGSLRADLDDYDPPETFTTPGESVGEEVGRPVGEPAKPPSRPPPAGNKPAAQADAQHLPAGEKLTGLPQDQDRGDDPGKY
jgi:hypothetical protein